MSIKRRLKRGSNKMAVNHVYTPFFSNAQEKPRRRLFNFFQERQLMKRGPIYLSEVRERFVDIEGLELVYALQSLINDGLVKEEPTLGAKNNMANYKPGDNKSYILNKEGLTAFLERWEDKWETQI